VRGQLHTLFVWAMHDDRKYIAVKPCTKQLEDDKAVEVGDVEDGRVLTADELRTFWFGVDDPKCPGDRLSKLSLKLSLVTPLRTGECVAVERTGGFPSTVTIPLKVAKGRVAGLAFFGASLIAFVVGCGWGGRTVIAAKERAETASIDKAAK
jgi:hypothetical protein